MRAKYEKHAEGGVGTKTTCLLLQKQPALEQNSVKAFLQLIAVLKWITI